jgi:hypothetical protein
MRLSQIARTSTMTVLGFSIGAAVSAMPVQIVGSLTQVDSGLASTFAIGQPFSMTFDWVGPGPASELGSANVQLYQEAGQNMALQIGDVSISSAVIGYLLKDQFYGSIDQFDITTFQYGTPWTVNQLAATPAVPGLFPVYAGMEFQDWTGQALASPYLSSALPDLDAYQQRSFILTFAQSIMSGAAFGAQRVVGTVTAVSVVPEPSSYALALAALAIMGAVRLHRLGERRQLAKVLGSS